MKLNELAKLLDLSSEELIARAKDFDINLLAADDEVDEEVVTMLREQLGMLAGSSVTDDEAKEIETPDIESNLSATGLDQPVLDDDVVADVMSDAGDAESFIEPIAAEEVMDTANSAPEEHPFEEGVEEAPATVDSVISDDMPDVGSLAEEMTNNNGGKEENEDLAQEMVAAEKPDNNGVSSVERNALTGDSMPQRGGEEPAQEDNAVNEQDMKQILEDLTQKLEGCKELKRGELQHLQDVGDSDPKKKADILERISALDNTIERVEENIERVKNGQAPLEEESGEESGEKKKNGIALLVQRVKEVVADFIFLTFKNKAHFTIIIAASVVSALVAVVLSFLLAAGGKTPDTVGTQEEQQAPTVVNIEGGFRSEGDLFRAIWELYAQGYNKMAYDSAMRFIEDYPLSEMLADVYYKIGDILYEWKRESQSLQYKKARTAYEKAIEIFPENNKVPWALYQIGNTYFMLKVYDQAEKVYRKVIEEFSDFREIGRVRSRLALAHLASGEYGRARLEYQKLIDTLPTSVFVNSSYLGIAETFYREDDYENAIKNYLNYIDRYPESPRLKEVYFRIAKLSEVRKNYEAAIMYYQRSIGDFPYDTYNKKAKYHIAECWLLQGDYDKAREMYQKIADEYPDNDFVGMVYHRIGDAYFKEGLLDKAIESYTLAIERYPTTTISKRSSIILGDIYFKKGEYKKMIDDYIELVEMDRNYFGNDRLLLRIAQAYFNNGDFLDAADWFLRLIKEYPTSALIRKAYFGKAKAEEQANYFDEAIKSYEEFILQYPDHPKVDFIMYQVGLMYERKGRYDEAIDMFSRLREKFVISEYRYKALVEIGKAFQAIAASESAVKQRAKQEGLDTDLVAVKQELLVNAEEAFSKILQNKALEGSDEYYDACLELARFYSDQEMFTIALDVLDKALAIYGGQKRAYKFLQGKGHICYKLNKLEETVTTYEDLIALLTEVMQDTALQEDEKTEYEVIVAESYIALGDILYAKDKFAEALYIYLEGIKHMPTTKARPWPFYQIANCYNRLNNYEKANFYYEKVKEDFPDNFWNEYIGWNQERMQWEQTLKAKDEKQ